MLNTVLLAIGAICGLNGPPENPDPESWFPEYNELAFFLGFLAPLIYITGALVEKEHFVANWKPILVRSLISNFFTFSTVSLGAAFFFPRLGIDSLKATDYLAIGAIFIPNNLVFALPAFPSPEGETYNEFGAVFGEGAFGIASSIILLKIFKGLEFSPRIISPSVMLLALGKFCFALVSSSVLGVFIGWLLSFHGWIAKLIHRIPKPVVDSDGNVVGDQELEEFIFVILSVPTFALSEFLNLSGTISVFLYAITTTYYLWPEVTEDSIMWRKDILCLCIFLKLILHLWIGTAAARMIQWSRLGNRPEAFTGIIVTLVILLLLGRVICEWHLSLWKIKKTETIEETSNALFFNRWRIADLELETQVNIWGSSLISSLVTFPLAYNQFGDSSETHKALIFNCVIIVYLCTLLVFGFLRTKWVLSVFTFMSIVKQSKLKLTTVSEGCDYVQIPVENE